MVIHMTKMVGNMFLSKVNQKKEDTHMGFYVRRNSRKYKIHYSL